MTTKESSNTVLKTFFMPGLSWCVRDKILNNYGYEVTKNTIIHQPFLIGNGIIDSCPL